MISCPKCHLGFPVPAVARARPDDDEEQPREAPPSEEDREDTVERRPRRKKSRRKKQKSTNFIPLIIGLVVLGVFLIGGGVAVAVVLWPAKKPEAVAQNSTPQSPPNVVSERPEGMNPNTGRDRGGALADTGSNPAMARPGAGGSFGSSPATGAEGQPRPGTNAPTRTGGAPERTSPPPSDSGSGASQDFAAAKKLFSELCSRCHALGGGGAMAGNFPGPRGGGGGAGMGRGPDLSTVGRDPTHTVDWLTKFIRNPRSVKPNARMKGFEGVIEQDDLRMLAQYLASLK